MGQPGGAMFGHGVDLRRLRQQADDVGARPTRREEKGYVPAGMGGFGGPPGRRTLGGPPGGGQFGMRPGQIGEILPMPIQQMLKLTDAQKKQLAELQRDSDERLKKILTRGAKLATEEPARASASFRPTRLRPPARPRFRYSTSNGTAQR